MRTDYLMPAFSIGIACSSIQRTRNGFGCVEPSTILISEPWKTRKTLLNSALIESDKSRDMQRPMKKIYFVFIDHNNRRLES